MRMHGLGALLGDISAFRCCLAPKYREGSLALVVAVCPPVVRTCRGDRVVDPALDPATLALSTFSRFLSCHSLLLVMGPVIRLSRRSAFASHRNTCVGLLRMGASWRAAGIGRTGIRTRASLGASSAPLAQCDTAGSVRRVRISEAGLFRNIENRGFSSPTPRGLLRG